MFDHSTAVAEPSTSWRMQVAVALMFSALTAVSAFARIPLTPVPVTLQVVFVLLSGLVLGPVWGPVSQAMYLMLGLAGAPVFAAPPFAGPAVLIGPTGGYLLGFVAGSWVAGYAGARIGRRLTGRLLACIGGIAAIYAAGTAWLSVWLSLNGRSAYLAFETGVKPFIAVDLLKAGFASVASGVLGGAPWPVRRIGG